MATIEEIITQLQSADEKVEEGVQILSEAESGAEEFEGQMAAIGIQDKAAVFAELRDSIQRTRQHLLGSRDLAEQSVNLAKEAGG